MPRNYALEMYNAVWNNDHQLAEQLLRAAPDDYRSAPQLSPMDSWDPMRYALYNCRDYNGDDRLFRAAVRFHRRHINNDELTYLKKAAKKAISIGNDAQQWKYIRIMLEEYRNEARFDFMCFFGEIFAELVNHNALVEAAYCIDCNPSINNIISASRFSTYLKIASEEGLSIIKRLLNNRYLVGTSALLQTILFAALSYNKTDCIHLLAKNYVTLHNNYLTKIESNNHINWQALRQYFQHAIFANEFNQIMINEQLGNMLTTDKENRNSYSSIIHTVANAMRERPESLSIRVTDYLKTHFKESHPVTLCPRNQYDEIRNDLNQARVLLISTLEKLLNIQIFIKDESSLLATRGAKTNNKTCLLLESNDNDNVRLLNTPDTFNPNAFTSIYNRELSSKCRSEYREIYKKERYQTRRHEAGKVILTAAKHGLNEDLSFFVNYCIDSEILGKAMHEAAQNNHWHCVQTLINAGFIATDHHKEALDILVAKQPNLAINLIEAGVQPEEKHFFINSDNQNLFALLRKLMAANLNVNFKKNQGEQNQQKTTPLTAAMDKNQNHSVKILMQNGAKAKHGYQWVRLHLNHIPLDGEINHATWNTIQAFLDNVHYPNKNAEVETECFYRAASQGHLGMVNFLLNRNTVDLSYQDPITAIKKTEQNNHYDCVKAIAEKASSAFNSAGLGLALLGLVTKHKTALAIYLIQQNAKTSFTNDAGLNAAQLAIECNEPTILANILMKDPQSVDRIDSHNNTPDSAFKMAVNEDTPQHQSMLEHCIAAYQNCQSQNLATNLDNRDIVELTTKLIAEKKWRLFAILHRDLNAMFTNSDNAGLLQLTYTTMKENNQNKAITWQCVHSLMDSLPIAKHNTALLAKLQHLAIEHNRDNEVEYIEDVIFEKLKPAPEVIEIIKEVEKEVIKEVNVEVEKTIIQEVEKPVEVRVIEEIEQHPELSDILLHLSQSALVGLPIASFLWLLGAADISNTLSLTTATGMLLFAGRGTPEIKPVYDWCQSVFNSCKNKIENNMTLTLQRAN